MINTVNLATSNYMNNKMSFKAISKPVQEFINLTKVTHPDGKKFSDLVSRFNRSNFTEKDLNAFENAVKNEENWKCLEGFKKGIKDSMIDFLEENGRKIN